MLDKDNSVITKTIAAIMVVMMLCAQITGCENADNEDSISESESTVVETLQLATEPAETTIEYSVNNSSDALQVITEYAQANNIDINSYPQEIVNMFVVFPDAYDFITQYPEQIVEYGEDSFYTYPDISGEISKVVVPRLYQWDTRWGYRDYCGQLFATNGSGPTCVAIAAIYFLGNTDFTPAWIMDYAINNSYCDVNGGGTYRTLITSGASGLGIDVVQITVDEDRIKRNLDVGNLVVCSMGMGYFSNFYETEHYIIITGYNDEGFTVIDPASRTRTEQTWAWEFLASSMNIPWVYRIM